MTWLPAGLPTQLELADARGPDALPWSGVGEFPPMRGSRVPKFVEDELGGFAAEAEVGRVEVWKRLNDLSATRSIPSDYIGWSALRYGVEQSFAPRARAAATTRLTRRTCEVFGLEDPYVLEFILSTVATVGMPGDPVWGFVVGAPSALKTEFLRWHKGLPQVYTLSRLTAHSLISGLKTGTSLLPELDGKTLVIKDFTTVLEMDRKARDEVFAQLRDSFDGFYEGHFGSIGRLSFTSHYHLLAAVTSAIEEYYSIQSSLGQRFLKVRVPPLDGFDRCLETGGREEELREEFTGLVRALHSRIDGAAWKSVRFEGAQELRPIVELLTRGRTHVSRFNGSISMLPEPELAPRVTKQLRKLAIGRALVYGRTEVVDSDLEFLRRVAFDTLPINRGLILRALERPKNVAQLAYFVRLPQSTIYRHLEDLDALDLVGSDGDKPATFNRIGPASAVYTLHSSEKASSDALLKEVGGAHSSNSGEPNGAPTSTAPRTSKDGTDGEAA